MTEPADAFALPEPLPRTIEESAKEALRLAAAGELYAACQEARLAIKWHGTIAGSVVALYVVDTALDIHRRKCRDQDPSMCAWSGVDDANPRARWAVRLAQARRDRNEKRVKSLMHTGTLVDVLAWAADVIRAAHSGPMAGLLKELIKDLDVWQKRQYVAPPARVANRKLVAKPSQVKQWPEGGYLGLGLWDAPDRERKSA